MTQKSFFWNGASIGDAQTWTPGGGYHMASEDYESPFVDIVCRALFNGTGNRGPLRNWLNELEVTGVATPVSVNTGSGFIYGLYYENDAALNVAVASPTYDTRIDRIVVRRDWATQTARVTRLPGTEGGGAPAMTQSPAPGGSGVYDIPLAQLSITTGGVITVTDEREYCTFSTAAGTNSIATATIPDATVDFAAREPVGKSLMFGGSEMLPQISYFAYTNPITTSTYLTGAVAATWGAAAATMEGWRCTGTGTAQTRNFMVTFRVPADYVPGTNIIPILWWVDDWAGASDFDIRSCWQTNLSGDEVVYSESYTTTDAIATSVLDTIRFSFLQQISGLVGGEMISYCVQYYNAAGAEAVLFAGLEFLYTGYA